MNERVRRVSIDNVDVRIAEIDENLVRLELTVLERSEQLAERKQLYEERHPGTGRGGDRRSSGHDDRLKPKTFIADASRRTGRAERSVRRGVRIGERIAPVGWRDSWTDTIRLFAEGW